MKRVKFVLAALIIALCAVVFAACDGMLGGGDNPKEVDRQYFAGDCLHKGYTRVFYDDGSHKDLIDKAYGDHEYGEPVVEQATCQKAGKSVKVCEVCNHSETEVLPKTNHEPSGELLYDAAGHWSVCKFGCGTIIGDVAPHDLQATETAVKTCVSYSYTLFKCKDCDYTEKQIDEDGGFGSHNYIALVCEYCNRDMLNDYIDEFSSKGDTEENPVILDNDLEAALFFDYLHLGLRDDVVWVNPTYMNFNTADATDDDAMRQLEQEVVSYVGKIIDAHTAGSLRSVNIEFSDHTPNVISLQLLDDFSQVASESPFDGAYGYDVYEESKSPLLADYVAVRGDDFDAFKYKTRTNTLSVSTSDQLYYAFSHGYKPLPQPGSRAENILTIAEGVARDIMDDGMSDYEKIEAIYVWLVNNVGYDNGAVIYLPDDSDWTLLQSYYLEGVFLNGTAVCDGISKAYCVLAGIEDIRCVQVKGDGLGRHAWNKLYLDVDGDGEKEWVLSDATFGNGVVYVPVGEGGATVEREILDMQYFIMNDDDRHETMQDIFNYADENTSSDIEFNHFQHVYVAGDYDLFIENDDELVGALASLAAFISDIDGGDAVALTLVLDDDYYNLGGFELAFSQSAYQAGIYDERDDVDIHYITPEQCEIGGDQGYKLTVVIYIV